MEVKYTKSYDTTLKKLKKHKLEFENLKRIIEIIERSPNMESLNFSPVAKIYGYEKLKGINLGFSSFNLCKNGGVIRLLITNSFNEKTFLCYISYKHYEDFDKKKVIHYDE